MRNHRIIIRNVGALCNIPQTKEVWLLTFYIAPLFSKWRKIWIRDVFWSQQLCWGQNTPRIQNKEVYATLRLRLEKLQYCVRLEKLHHCVRLERLLVVCGRWPAANHRRKHSRESNLLVPALFPVEPVARRPHSAQHTAHIRYDRAGVLLAATHPASL